MENSKDFLLPITQRIFSNWSALKIAVEHGMGTKEKAIDFCSYTTEILCMNDNLNTTELATELEDYMDEQFNVELQDDSAIQVAMELLRFYQYHVNGQDSNALAEFEKLPVLQPWMSSSVTFKKENKSIPITSDNCCLNESQEMNVDVDIVQEQDEWIKVENKRKR